MMHLLRSELFRMWKRPQTWILAIIMVLSSAAFYTAMTISTFFLYDPTSAEESLQLSNVFEHGMQLVTFVGYILTVVLASGLIGNEYGWNTIRPLLARSTSRSALLSAKWAALVLASIGLFTIGLLASLVFSAAGSMVAGVFEGVGPGVIGEWAISYLRLLVSQLPYAILAFCFALWTRSNAVGIAIGIGIGILEPAIWSLLGLVTDAFDSVRKFGIEYPSTLLFNLNSGLNDASTGDAWRAVGVLLGWIALLVAGSYVVFTRRDVTSG